MTTFKDPREGKMEFEDWKDNRKKELFNEFWEDNNDIRKITFMAIDSVLEHDLKEYIKIMFEEYCNVQYEQYLDTEEFDHSSVGCSGNEER